MYASYHQLHHLPRYTTLPYKVMLINGYKILLFYAITKGTNFSDLVKKRLIIGTI